MKPFLCASLLFVSACQYMPDCMLREGTTGMCITKKEWASGSVTQRKYGTYGTAYSLDPYIADQEQTNEMIRDYMIRHGYVK